MERFQLFQLLHQGLISLRQILTPVQQNQLIHYVKLIERNNRVYRLTNVGNPDKIIVRHLLDSLSVVPFLKKNIFIDVGTGAGLPGIPLGIALPHINFVLLDADRKKREFLKDAVYKLRCGSNIKVIQRRVEMYVPEKLFEGLICRNFGTLPCFFDQIKHLLAPQAQLLLMRGVYPQTELPTIQAPFKLIGVHAVKVPFLDAERHVVEIMYEGE